MNNSPKSDAGAARTNECNRRVIEGESVTKSVEMEKPF